MERNSLSDMLIKDHSIGTRAIKDYINNSDNMPKDSVKVDSQSSGDDFVTGFSWPPRSYTCSFCKREFRSAQALGGHMNVHRRDRARLRESPPRDGQYPTLNLSFNPNPNPNPMSSSSSSSPSPRLTPFALALPSLISPPLSSSLTSPSSTSSVKKWGVVRSLFDSCSPKSMDLTNMNRDTSFDVYETFDGSQQRDEFIIAKNPEIVRLDLEIGVLGDSKEDIDLELRLGYS